MSGAKIFNIPTNSWISGPDFAPKRDKTGKWTATQTFKINKADKSSSIILAAFCSGRPLPYVYPEAGSFWSFLKIDTIDFQDNPGGITDLIATFSGYTESGDFGVEGRDKRYTRNDSLTERPIIEHPKFLSEVTGSFRDVLVGVYNGQIQRVANETGSAQYTPLVIATNTLLTPITDADAQKWWDRILRKRTYEDRQSEWTESKTNFGALSDGDMTMFGKIDIPPGSPGAPPNTVWRFTGATEDIGGDVSSTARTWTTIEDNDDNQDLYS